MGESIFLTPFERQSLINQYRILQKLTSDEREQKDYENKITALASGYELHYQEALEDISEESLSSDACREVLDILEMFRGITYSYMHIENKNPTLQKDRIRFAGFDGNYETKQMLYCRYFIHDLERYSEIEELCGERFDYNSHCGMLSTYRQMLQTWNQYRRQLDNPYMMTEEQISQLLKPYHPMLF